ncbi:MAG: TetR/AcrR family transcriptional regulator [Bacteroidota bacterium]
MAETKEKLLTLAFMEFLKRPYREVTLEQLVKELGLTKGAFYHNFESKQDLFVKVVDMYLDSFDDMYERSYNATLPLVENIMEVVQISIERMTQLKEAVPEDVDELNFFGFIMDAMKYYPGFKRKMAGIHKNKEMALYVRFINEAKCNKDIRVSVDSLLLAATFMHLFDGIAMGEYLKGKNGDVLSSIRNSLEFICDLAAK